MTFERMKKAFANAASTTAKKAGEQVKITRLELSKNGLQKEIDGLYAEIGRCCYAKVKDGADFGEGIAAYCGDIDALSLRIAQIENEISAHKLERDSAQYSFSGSAAGVEIPLGEAQEDFCCGEDENDADAEVLPFPVVNESGEQTPEAPAEASDGACGETQPPDGPQIGAPCADPVNAPDGPAAT